MARHGNATLQDPGDGDYRAVGLSTGLQSDPVIDGAGRPAGRSDPEVIELQHTVQI